MIYVSIDILLCMIIALFIAGYQGGVFYSNAYYGKGTGSIFLDNIQCNGTEDRLIDCSHSSIGSSNCVHSDDVSVFCFFESECIIMVDVDLLLCTMFEYESCESKMTIIIYNCSLFLSKHSQRELLFFLVTMFNHPLITME